MISIKLMGGLCNQMFQISAAYALALNTKDSWGIDVNSYFLPYQGNPPAEYNRTLYYQIPKITLADYRFRGYSEPRWEYDQIPQRRRMLLSGYFQSHKYFKGHDAAIKELFFNKEITSFLLWLLKERYSVELRNSVGLHIRRGDYLKFTGHHPFPGHNYYYMALDHIAKLHKVDCIMLFSDDIPWCKKEFRGNEVRYVEGLSDVESLVLMGLCNHNIIANSSFSWWASYFNENKDRIICAPKRWFGSKVTHGWDDIYRDEMVVL